MSIVILAEKPSQAMDYAKAFNSMKRKDGYIEVNDSRFFNGKNAVITWGIGHLVELAQPKDYNSDWEKWDLDALPIVPDQFKFKVSPDKRKQFNTVKKLLNQAEEIIVATDPDREGENIARSIIRLAGASDKPTRRLWVNSLVVDAIQKGFKNLREGSNYMNLYREAETRQKSDWLVGINASRLYTLLLQQKGVRGSFSVGRVQTPTLYLVYKRQKEHENFKSVPFYEVYGDVSVGDHKFEVKHSKRFDQLQSAVSYLEEKSVVEGENRGVVKSVEKEKKKTLAPKLHSLSTLQSKANKKWKYSPTETLEIVQSLYEKKVVSYPRTSCQYITKNEFDYIVDHVEDYKELLGVDVDTSRKEIRKRYVNDSEVGEHYAIVPTEIIADMDDLDEREKHIYKEILASAVAMFAPDYEYEQTKVEIDVNGIVLGAKGKVELHSGWKKIFIEEEKEDNTVFPTLSEGDKCSVIIKTKKGMTKPPKLYTEGELINVMKNAGRGVEDEEAQKILKENEGIGTEATRGSIIETLKQQNYIKISKNTVKVTEKGEILCKAVEGSLLASPEMTAKWEEYLSKIGKGERTQQGFLQNIEKFLYKLVEDSKKTISKLDDDIENLRESSRVGECPSCDGGSIEDRGNFYGCTNYSDGCKFTLPKRWAGKAIPLKQIQNLLLKGETDLIKGFKSKKGNKFDAHLVLKDGKLEMKFSE